MLCEHIVEYKCPKGHVQKRKCHTNQPSACRYCQREDEKRQKELRVEAERQVRREQREREHAEKMAELDRQIRLVREKAADSRAADENAHALERKKLDLEAAKHASEAAAAPIRNVSSSSYSANSYFEGSSSG